MGGHPHDQRRERLEEATSHEQADALVISKVKWASDTETRDVSVARVLEGIRSSKKLKGRITQIRNRFETELVIAQANAEAGQNVNPRLVAKLAVSELKKQLPAVMWCGQYSSRKEPVPENSRNILAHSPAT